MDPANEPAAEARRLSKPLSIEKASRRTRLWSDQATPRLSAVSSAGTRESRCGVELALHRSQPAEAGEGVVVNGITLRIFAHNPKIGAPCARETALEGPELGFIDSSCGFPEAKPSELAHLRVSWTGS